MKKGKEISNLKATFKRSARTDFLVTKVETAIKRNQDDLPSKCTVYPYWLIDIYPPKRKKIYPHLTVLTDIETDKKIRMRLLRIEIDDYTRHPKALISKMIGITGHGIVLSPISCRIDKLINAYHIVAKQESVAADGIFFCVMKDFLNNGLLATFRTIDGTTVNLTGKINL